MVIQFPIESSPTIWAVGLVAAFLVGTSKTGLTGVGILAIALFAQVLPARSSTGAVLPLLIIADIVAVAIFRRHADWSHLAKLFPVTAIGVGLGALALRSPYLRSNDSVKVVIGAIIVLMVLYAYIQRWQKKNQKTESEEPQSPQWIKIAGTGLAAGFLTMVANAAGPVMVLYLLAARLPKNRFLGTGAWFFFLMNLFKVPFSVSLGLITPASMSFDLILAPLVIAGALSGRWIISRINQRAFEELTLALTLLSGANLLLSPFLSR